MKNLKIVLLLLAFVPFCNAQQVSGKLTLNGKSETKLELKTNSVVQLLKGFKTGKHKLNLSFNAKEVPVNIYKEAIIFFNLTTNIKKDGKLIKRVQHKYPLLFFPGEQAFPGDQAFPGEQALPVEAFGFIGALADSLEDDEPADEMIGTMPEGKYTLQLIAKPVGFKGEIAPLELGFILRKRPGRAKY